MITGTAEAAANRRQQRLLPNLEVVSEEAAQEEIFVASETRWQLLEGDAHVVRGASQVRIVLVRERQDAAMCEVDQRRDRVLHIGDFVQQRANQRRRQVGGRVVESGRHRAGGGVAIVERSRPVIGSSRSSIGRPSASTTRPRRLSPTVTRSYDGAANGVGRLWQVPCSIEG